MNKEKFIMRFRQGVAGEEEGTRLSCGDLGLTTRLCLRNLRRL